MLKLKTNSQFGTYEDLSPISNIEDAKLRHVHSSRTVASLHENLPEHSGNSKFKKDNYAEAKDNSQFGTYEDLSPISNIEDAKLRHVHSSRTVASLHENLPEHSGNSKFKKDNYAEAKDNSQFGTYEDLSPISNIEDAKLRHVHSSRTVASLHENLPEHSGNSKFKKDNYAEAKDNSQFGTYEDLSPISNIEDAKLRHVHSSRTVASLHENLPEHSGNSKFKKENYAEAKYYSQFGTYEDLSPISNIEDAKLRHVHSSRTVASLHENLPEHSGNSKFKKGNYAEAKDYSQFGTYEDLSPISNIEDAKLRHVHSSRTVASLHENLPEHSGNSKFKKENYAEAKYYSQFGTYEDLSPISNIEDVKLRHVHSSRTVASLHENLPEHSGNSKFKKGNYAEAKDYSQFGTYEDLSPISNIEDAKLRHVHSSRTVASLHENLTEHTSEKTDSTKEKNKSVESSADCAEYQKCYEDSNIIYSEKGKDQIMKELNQIKAENRNLSSQLQKILISHELILSNFNKMMKQVNSESVVSDHLNSDKKIHESLSKKGQFQGSEDSVSFGLNASGEEVGFDTPVARSSFIIEESNAQPIDKKELLNSNVNFQNYDEISPIIFPSTGEDNCARSDATAIIPSVFSIKGLNSQSIDEENYFVQSDAQDDGDEITFTISAEEDEAGGRLSEPVEMSGFKLVHKNEPEVNRALALPCDDRRKIFELLRKRGIDYENQRRLKSNAVQKSCEDLIGERKTHANKVRRCPVCKGFYVSKYFTLHIKKCEEKYNCSSHADPIKFSSKTGHVLLEEDFSNVPFNSSYVSQVLERFKDDDIGNMCRTNKLLIYIGYYLFLSKAEEKAEEREKSQTDKKYIMGKMRLLCRLYVQFKSEIQKDVSLQEMFNRSYMPEFKRAVLKTVEKAKTSRHILGFLILKTISILESRLSVLKREDEGKEMVEFRKSLNNSIIWIPLFGKQRTYRASRSQFQIKKPTNLPREEDMRKVRSFLLNGIEKFSSQDEFDPRNFKILRRLLVTRITFLNARRGGEPCRLLISQWEEAKQDQWLNQDFVKAALNTKIGRFKSFKRI
ncbi:hypothetical protein Avbf_10768 [Armadillidium vulgare]|nr:hypothetical protein Avbf_10768 [Armadillidium vulgare]